ncbi:MAG: hypothetical protein HF314_12105 [Ignavibacteria bacterium]|jgi:Mor family transcriptional regulator|nr:hypothetical protein [Ignavibacteria bacterium]MCU7503814.1 hypothetical protein [Ignavibacteria bacterium]MCU7517172.1 hypothetical protein [Ignavibacteria bacterium]
MTGLDWIKEIDWEESLSGDLKEIAKLCGINTLLTLWENFGKTNIYFSERPLDALRRKYIIHNKDKSVKELARKLEVSEMFVYNCLQEIKLKEDTLNLFEKN